MASTGPLHLHLTQTSKGVGGWDQRPKAFKGNRSPGSPKKRRGSTPRDVTVKDDGDNSPFVIIMLGTVMSILIHFHV